MQRPRFNAQDHQKGKKNGQNTPNSHFHHLIYTLNLNYIFRTMICLSLATFDIFSFWDRVLLSCLCWPGTSNFPALPWFAGMHHAQTATLNLIFCHPLSPGFASVTLACLLFLALPEPFPNPWPLPMPWALFSQTSWFAPWSSPSGFWLNAIKENISGYFI